MSKISDIKAKSGSQLKRVTVQRNLPRNPDEVNETDLLPAAAEQTPAVTGILAERRIKKLERESAERSRKTALIKRENVLDYKLELMAEAAKKQIHASYQELAGDIDNAAVEASQKIELETAMILTRYTGECGKFIKSVENHANELYQRGEIAEEDAKAMIQTAIESAESCKTVGKIAATNLSRNRLENISKTTE